MARAAWTHGARRHYRTTTMIDRNNFAKMRALHKEIKFWKRLCAMLGTLLLACAIVIVLQYLKLP